MTVKLPVAIETPQQLQAAIYEIERYLEWLRASEAKQHVGQKGGAGEEPSCSAETQTLITEQLQGHPVSPAKLEEVLATLRATQPPILHLVLAGLAPPALRRRLVEWVRVNGHPEALVQLTADSTIGGGVMIRTPDHLYDESFRTKLLAHRGELIKALQHVR